MNIRRIFLTGIGTCLLLSGCGSSDNSYSTVADQGTYNTEISDVEMDYVGLTGSTQESESENGGSVNSDASNENLNQVMSQEKMIYKTYIDAETLTFDRTYADLKALLNKYDCIISNESISNDGSSYMNSGYRSSRNGYTTEREAYVEIRVPAANYTTLLENVEGLGNVTSKDSSATNITRSYYDTKAELAAYEEEYLQLQKLLELSGDMSDILSVTEQMTQVRSEINRLNSNIQNMDIDVAYSYIYLTLTEVVEYTQPQVGRSTETFWDRFKNNFEDTYTGFLDFLEGFLFFIIRVIPYAVFIAIIVFVYRKTPLHRMFKKKREEKKQEKLKP
jgi:hypothetical protein